MRSTLETNKENLVWLKTINEERKTDVIEIEQKRDDCKALKKYECLKYPMK